MLELRGLTKRYGEVTALDGAGFAVRRGQMLGFLGPNGAGKTTTMRSIFGLVQLDAGTVTWDGEPVTPQARLGFGYMPEERGLYARMRIGEQLVYFGRLHGMERAAAQDAATTWLSKLGLGDRIDSRVEELSHGNQQRAQLATALLHRPELAVLDEPFAGLDPLGVTTMANVLQRRAEEGAAVVFSSHQLDLVEDLCEDVVIIDHGRVVLAGRLAHLKAATNHRRLEIEIDGSDLTWLDRIPDVFKASVANGAIRLTVEPDADIGAILAAARAAGTVTTFNFSPPSLSELFAEAVQK
jgi:ABC-2 type transport system ATP-binding protein